MLIIIGYWKYLAAAPIPYGIMKCSVVIARLITNIATN